MSKAGEGKFEQQEDENVKNGDLNGLGGDLLSMKQVAPEKTAEKVDQLKHMGDKSAPKITDVTDGAKEAAMTQSVMENLNKSVAEKVAGLNNSDEGKELLKNSNGKNGTLGEQFKGVFKNLPADVQKQLVAMGN